MLWWIDGWLARGPVGGYNVNNLRYADDITLTSVADMAELLKRVKVESELLGLRLNVIKTKIVAIGPDSEEPIIINMAMRWNQSPRSTS